MLIPATCSAALPSPPPPPKQETLRAQAMRHTVVVGRSRPINPEHHAPVCYLTAATCLIVPSAPLGSAPAPSTHTQAQLVSCTPMRIGFAQQSRSPLEFGYDPIPCSQAMRHRLADMCAHGRLYEWPAPSALTQLVALALRRHDCRHPLGLTLWPSVRPFIGPIRAKARRGCCGIAHACAAQSSQLRLVL